MKRSMKKAVRRFCRKHYKGLLLSIEVVKRIFRVLFVIGIVYFFALGSSEAPILEVAVQMVLTGIFVFFCYQMAYDEEDFEKMMYEED